MMKKYLILCGLAFVLSLVGGIVLLAIGILSLKTESQNGAIAMIVCGAILLYGMLTTLWILCGMHFCCKETGNLLDNTVKTVAH